MAEDAPSPESENASPKRAAADEGSAIVIGEQYHVFPSLPLPALDSGGGRAYVAENKKRDERGIYALVADPKLPPRADMLNFLVSVEVPGLVNLIDYEIDYWPLLGRRAMIFLFDRPAGSRVELEGRGIPPIGEHDVGPKMVQPLLATLTALNDKGMTHRGIRVNNLYWNSPECKSVLLGEGFLGPPAYFQPLVYEPPNRALAARAGRGSGELGDDLYALGVTVALVGLGFDPMASMSDRDIVEAKIAKGSFQAVVGSERIPLTLLEPARGLMCDDPMERWGMNELSMWLDGRRQGPIQARQEKRAARAQSFAGKDYFTCSALADAFANNWAAALKPIREGLIEVWLRRGMADADRARRVSDAVKAASWAGGDKRLAEDILIARTILALDPTGPIRHKGFSAMPDGIGEMLAYDVASGQGPQAWAETVIHDIARGWLEYQTRYSPEHNLLDQTFKGLKYYLQQGGPGYGWERCLYTLNGYQHCLSPLVEPEHVVSIDALLPALNRVAAAADHSSWPMDRHLAAFIAARIADDVEAQLGALENPGDEVEYSRAIVSLLALVQWRHGPDTVNELAAWVGQRMRPAINVFHSAERRERVAKEIPRLVRKGNLVDLYNLINDEDERRRDQEEFMRAIDQYTSAEAEIFDLESSGPARVEMAEMLGQQAAAFAATMIAVITVFFLLVFSMF